MPEWWREYPERDCEYVTYYPVAIEPMTADDVWATPRTSSAEAGLYVHVPLCRQLCPFCNYNKFVTGQHDVGALADGIAREIALYGEMLQPGSRRVPCVYFGGGTPSTLPLADMERILTAARRAFTIDDDTEISVEVHPTDATLPYLQGLRALGVSRVSFGIQSFNDRLLQAIGSHHSGDDARAALAAARAAGFDDVVSDLMFLLPTQTIEDWDADLATMADLGAVHISLYRMLLDPSGPLARKIRTRRVERQGSQQLELELAERGLDALAERGFEHYGSCSSSGYDLCLPGYRSRYEEHHRAAPQGELIPIGPGAAGFANGCVYWTIHTVPEYLAEVHAGRLPVLAGRRLTREDELSRYAVMGIKHLTLPKAPFAATYGVAFDDAFGATVARLERHGLVVDSADAVRATRHGVLYLDNVCKAFYDADNYRVPQPYKIALQLMSRDLFEALPSA